MRSYVDRLSIEIMSKKKRVAVSFDLESVKHRMREEDVYADGIRKHLDALRNVDIKRIASTLKEAEILQVLVCKLGVETLETLRKAAQHVPRNICRVVNEKSLRIDYIHKIFTLVSTNVNGNTRCRVLCKHNGIVLFIPFLDARPGRQAIRAN